jgi:hypothetical protein
MKTIKTKTAAVGGILLAIVMALMLNTNAQASNIQIPTEPRIAEGGSGYKIVRFDLTWEYSWRSAQLRNWDGAWVFVKYRVGMDNWDHMYLDPLYDPKTGYTNGGTVMAHQYGTTGSGENAKTVGIFLFREANGQGNINWTNIALRWRFDQKNTYVSRDQLFADDDVIVRVFAIEMVFVPEGPFYLGDGANKAGNFCRADALYNSTSNIIIPFQVLSESSAIGIGMRPDDPDDVDDMAGYLSAVGLNAEAVLITTGLGIGEAGSTAIRTTYPKGYQAFWIMKYEITQSAYTDFLNTLTTAQQASRIRTGSDAGLNTRAMTVDSDRNGIRVKTPGTIEFGMDMHGANHATGNGTFDDENDGHGVACAMGKGDFMAYLDWSGLRPMTELEYEKACRGPLSPIQGEYPWGATFVVPAVGTNSQTNAQMVNIGLPTEAITSPAGVNHNCQGTLNNIAVHVLLVTRNGAFATANSDRIKSGATYWGVMEMGSNLAEPVVNISTTEGRTYTGTHGDGRLSLDGNSNVLLWPQGPDFPGMGHRGGNVANGLSGFVGVGLQTTSSREAVVNSWPHRYFTGGRGVRTASASGTNFNAN